MRRYAASIFCAGIVLLAVAAAAAPATEEAASPRVSAPAPRAMLPVLRDEAAMVLVGTALIGLASVVRRGT